MMKSMFRRFFLLLGCSLFWHCCSGMAADIQGPLPLEIRERVYRFLLDNVQADSIDLRVQVPTSIGGGIDESDVLNIRVDWQKGKEDLAGRVVIPVCIRIRGDQYITTYATATIRLFDRVYVTQSLLNRHHIISRDNVQKVMRDVTKLNGSPFKSTQDLVESRTKRVIGKGRIVTEDMVESPPLIHQGDRVQLVLVYGNLRVTAMGFARKDGWMGDRIRVRNPKNRREIIGRVVNRNEVVVEM
jgi:flagella basal body P-ring formation protein FlgA